MYFSETVSTTDYLNQFKDSKFCKSEILKKGDEYIKIRLVACVSFLYVSTLRSSDLKVRIHSKTIRNFLGEYSSSFIGFVCSVGKPQMFSFGENYKVGERSTEYCRNSDYRGEFRPCVEFESHHVEKFFKSYDKKRKIENSKLPFPVSELKAIAAKITVDRSKIQDATEKYIERKKKLNEPYDKEKALSLLDIVECGPTHHGYFFFRENSRVYSSITNLPREFRSLLRYQGLPFVELDQCASQPFLLLRLYQDIKSADAKAESAHYADLWNVTKNNGDFYRNLIPDMDPAKRNIIKSCLINDYLNRAEYMNIKDPERANLRSRFDSEFCNRFPILRKEIHALKTERRSEISISDNGVHSQFAVKMQQLESNVFIDRIAAECLLNEIPIYTVHDCIGCLKQYQQKVKSIAIKQLTEFCGFEPRFK